MIAGLAGRDGRAVEGLGVDLEVGERVDSWEREGGAMVLIAVLAAPAASLGPGCGGAGF